MCPGVDGDRPGKAINGQSFNLSNSAVRSSFVVRSFVVRSFVRRFANFNFAKAGARLGPAVRLGSDGGGPSLGKIKI